jgi:hypothetical protein
MRDRQVMPAWPPPTCSAKVERSLGDASGDHRRRLGGVGDRRVAVERSSITGCPPRMKVHWRSTSTSTGLPRDVTENDELPSAVISSGPPQRISSILTRRRGGFKPSRTPVPRGRRPRSCRSHTVTCRAAGATLLAACVDAGALLVHELFAQDVCVPAVLSELAQHV